MKKNINKNQKMLSIVKNCANQSLSLNDTFEIISDELNLKKGSAKNYYYNFLKNLKNNPMIAKTEGINLSNLTKSNFEKFNSYEIKNLITTIDQNLEKGISVRQSCLMLANNDAKLMLRLQNKYRNFKKLLNKDIYYEVNGNSKNKKSEIDINLKNLTYKNLQGKSEGLKESKINYKNSNSQIDQKDSYLNTFNLNNKLLFNQVKESEINNSKNVDNKENIKSENIININFAKDKINRKISDSELNALFMGLVKIVKKSAIDSANLELKNECEIANKNFRQTLIDLNRKEAELKLSREINKELNLKVETQKQQICLLLQRLSDRRLKNLERKSELKTMKLKNFDLSK